jgi:hypothetical protein
VIIETEKKLVPMISAQVFLVASLIIVGTAYSFPTKPNRYGLLNFRRNYSHRDVDDNSHSQLSQSLVDNQTTVPKNVLGKPVVKKQVAVGIIETLCNEVSRNLDSSLVDLVSNSLPAPSPLLERIMHTFLFDFAFNLYNAVTENSIQPTSSQDVESARSGDEEEHEGGSQVEVEDFGNVNTNLTVENDGDDETRRVVVVIIVSNSSNSPNVKVINTFKICTPPVDVQTQDHVSSFSESLIPSTEILELLQNLHPNTDTYTDTGTNTNTKRRKKDTKRQIKRKNNMSRGNFDTYIDTNANINTDANLGSNGNGNDVVTIVLSPDTPTTPTSPPLPTRPHSKAGPLTKLHSLDRHSLLPSPTRSPCRETDVGDAIAQFLKLSVVSCLVHLASREVMCFVIETIQHISGLDI